MTPQKLIVLGYRYNAMKVPVVQQGWKASEKAEPTLVTMNAHVVAGRQGTNFDDAHRR